jgi:hypothetical protein
MDINPGSPTREGNRKQPPDSSQPTGSSKHITTRGGNLAVNTGEPRSNDPTSLNSLLRCIRISGLPSSWSEDDLFDVLHTVDPLLTRQDYRPSLYPSCFASTQIALVNLDRTKHLKRLNYIQVPESASRTETRLTIDSCFYNLTPLNVPMGEVVAELAAVRALEEI